jgi:NADH:ubiquinone oxidoreductase subunit H
MLFFFKNFFIIGFNFFLLSYFTTSFLLIFDILSWVNSALILGLCITLIYVLGLILTAAFLTLFERQVLGSIQHRKGPNVVGFGGIFQPISDAVKLLIKEPLIPKKADYFLFFLSSVIIILLSLLV